MSDEKKKEEIAEITITATRTPIITRRMRPANQTETQKAAWDEKTQLLRNTRAREARLRKKLTASAIPTISSAIPTPLTLPIPLQTSPPPPQISPTSPALPTPSQTSQPPPPPISLDDVEIQRAIERLLRLRNPNAIRDRLWELHASQPYTLTTERRRPGRINVTKARAPRQTVRD